MHGNVDAILCFFVFFSRPHEQGARVLTTTCMASNRLENEPLPLVSARPLDLDQLGLLSDDQRLINQNWIAIQIVFEIRQKIHCTCTDNYIDIDYMSH